MKIYTCQYTIRVDCKLRAVVLSLNPLPLAISINNITTRLA